MTLCRWVAAGLVAFTVYGGLLPFHFTPMPLPEAVAAFRAAPLWNPSDLLARGDWVISFVQFTLVGYVLMAAVCWDGRRNTSRTRRFVVSIAAALVVVPACVGLAVGMEFLQVYFPPRTVSVNDMVIESAGGLLGVAVWLAVGRRVTAWASRLEGITSLGGLARRLLPAYVIVLLIVELMPFDFVADRTELAAKAASGNVRLMPYAGKLNREAVTSAIINVAAFVPLGLLAVLSRRRLRFATDSVTRPIDLSTVLLAAAVIEVLKLFVFSRTFDTGNILTGMIGVLIGWRVGWELSTPPLAAWATAPRLGLLGPSLWLAWLGAVLYCNWSPFDFTTDPARFADDSPYLPVVGLRHMALAPFADYYWSSKYVALDRFMFKALSFLPMGALLALGSRSIYQPRCDWRVVGWAAIVAVIIEAGRYFVPSRLPSVTDILIQCAGAWLGFRLTQFVRATLWAEATLYGWLRTPIVPLHFISSQPDVLPLVRPPQPRA
jgi:VanZ family protein